MCHRSGCAEGRTPSVRTYRGELLPPFGAPCCLPTITRHVGQYARCMSPCCRATTTFPFLSNHLSRFRPLGLAPPSVVRQAEWGSLGAARALVAASLLGRGCESCECAAHVPAAALVVAPSPASLASSSATVWKPAGSGRFVPVTALGAAAGAQRNCGRTNGTCLSCGATRLDAAKGREAQDQSALGPRLPLPTRTWRMSSAMREVHSASGKCAGAKGRRTATGSHLPPPSSGAASRHRTGAVRSSGVCRVLTLSPYSLKRMSRLPSTASSSAPTT